LARLRTFFAPECLTDRWHVEAGKVTAHEVCIIGRAEPSEAFVHDDVAAQSELAHFFHIGLPP